MNKAIKEKKVIDFKHIKILLTGSSAAGKSSFCQLLFGSEKFSNKYKSTDILENKQALSVVKRKSEKKDEAITVKNLSMLKQKEEVVWYELNLETQMQYLRSLLEQKKFHNQAVDVCGDASSDKLEGNYVDVDDDDEEIDDDVPEESQTDLKRKLVEAKPLPDSLTTDIVKLVTVVDTGGQPEYIHLLPVINSYPAVTFIVHDLNEELYEKVKVYRGVDGKRIEERTLNFSYLDMIHLLMCFVSDTLEQNPEQISPYNPKKSFIGFVGTHYDEVRGNPTIIENINEKLKEIVEERRFTSGGVLRSKIGIIHLVDNTTAGNSENEDSDAKQIRTEVEKLTNQVESKKLPITWMILQLRVRQLCTTDHRKYIKYEEYAKIATEESLSDDKEVKASLIYFCFSGLLLYFEDPSLCNCIIIDLQWLYISLAKVMHLSSEDVTFSDYKSQDIFNKLRLLSKVDYVDAVQLKDINLQELESFFNILIHLKIIATVTVNSTEYFYLPCVLSNSEMCGNKQNKHEYLLNEPLLIQFESGFLPRGFFCSLVVFLLNKEPKGWKHQLDLGTKNYSDLMIFRLPDGSYLYMHDKIFYLELRVRHSKSGFVSSYQNDIFVELHEYLELVCSHLCFDLQKLQYGFLCKANHSNDNHIAVIDLSEVLESMQTKSQFYIQCNRKCANETKLEKSHTIWFEKVSAYSAYLYIMMYT